MKLKDFINTAQVGSTIVISDSKIKRKFCVVAGNVLASNNPVLHLYNRDIIRHNASNGYRYDVVV